MTEVVIDNVKLFNNYQYFDRNRFVDLISGFDYLNIL